MIHQLFFATVLPLIPLGFVGLALRALGFKILLIREPPRFDPSSSDALAPFARNKGPST